MSEANNEKGRDFILQLFDDITDPIAGKWRSIGGIRTKDFSIDNPVSDTTSQSTLGEFTESQFNGYSTVTFNGNGTVDKRYSDEILAYSVLEQICMTGNRCARLRLVDSISTVEGIFTITTFSKSAEQQGLVEFTLAAQSTADVSYS